LFTPHYVIHLGVSYSKVSSSVADSVFMEEIMILVYVAVADLRLKTLKTRTIVF